jgi:ATP-dependent RNA helicase DDX27
MAMDFVGTIDSDDEISNHGEPSRPRTTKGKASAAEPRRSKVDDSAGAGEKEDELNPDFEFDTGGANIGMEAWGGDEIREAKSGAEVSL